MNHTIEKNEQYVLVTINEALLGVNIAAQLEKVVVVLYREGYTNIIFDLDAVKTVDNDGLTLLRKVTKVCRNEGGLFIIVAQEDDVLDDIDRAGIKELITLATLDEAIDVVFMNETDNDFPEEDDDEYFAEQGEGGGGGDDRF